MSETYRVATESVPVAQDLSEAQGWIGMKVQFLVDSLSGGAESIVFGRTIFAPGASQHGLHRHENAEEVVLIVRGKGVVLNGDEEVEVGPGDVAFHPRGLWHGFRNTSTSEDTEMLWAWGGAGSRATAGYEPMSSSASHSHD